MTHNIKKEFPAYLDPLSRLPLTIVDNVKE